MINKEFSIFYIPKTKGYRKIVTYKNKESTLYNFHKNALKSLDERLVQSKFAKAYIKKRSIITNVKAHLYNDIFISLDIKDFFQSINHNILVDKLFYEINKNRVQLISKQNCIELVESCAISCNGLAIGLIPSPSLANIYLKEFDQILYGTIKKLNLNNLIYTRYADDLTISYRMGSLDNNINDTITNIAISSLKKYGLKLNLSKKRIVNLNKSKHVRITGISIISDNDNYRKLSVGRKKKDSLYWEAISLINESEHNTDWQEKAKRVKGLQSFILMIEGETYQNTYSLEMQNKIKNLGYDSLKSLIDNLA